MTASDVHDLVVIGGGPAGLSAAVYGARAGLSTLVLEQSIPGGQAALTNEIDNYPGLPNSVGSNLGMRMSEHAERVGASFEYDKATNLIKLEDGNFLVKTDGGAAHTSPAVIYAAGATPRAAGFEGESAFRGHGVSYCATCDGMFYRGKDVYVIGGGTAACEEALYLANFVQTVTMIVRRDSLRTIPSLSRRILNNEKIAVRFNRRVATVSGEQTLDEIVTEDILSGAREVIRHDEPFGVFVFSGHDPAIELVTDLVDTNSNGVITDSRMTTRTQGLFAAGDVRDTVLRQVATAVSDGAIAATSALAYIQAHLDV